MVWVQQKQSECSAKEASGWHMEHIIGSRLAFVLQYAIYTLWLVQVNLLDVDHKL